MSQFLGDFLPILLSKIYDKPDDCDFDIVNFPFLDGTFLVLPLTVFTFLNSFDLLECLLMILTSLSVIEILNGKLLHQGYRYHKLRKAFFLYFIADTMNWFQGRIKISFSTWPIGIETLWCLGL